MIHLMLVLQAQITRSVKSLDIPHGDPMPEDTDQKTRAVKAGHRTPWRFQPGQSGNPSGRPRGARSKLSETLLEALQRDFLEHGPAVIEEARKNDPSTYLKIRAGPGPTPPGAGLL